MSGSTQSTSCANTTDPATADEKWNEFAEKLYERDKITAKAWKDEIDTLLTFAGLYSVILTAFNIELYKPLQPSDPTSDSSTQALIHLIGILSNGSIPPVLAASSGDTKPPPSASVWINALMFSSLVLSLSSASISILVRQWLNSFINPHSGNGMRSAYIHCLRWNRGLELWKVHWILNTLSILLQLALGLFLFGLLIFLWTLNKNVAAAPTLFAGSLGTFWIFSTLAPAFCPSCPYKSPQS
ncbi:hypothetical protein OBBRIDRAFT_739411, partial [Obba rivulosa]